jgi:ubiquinone/menaquinone biosynthesis C-methylase UbiE
MNEQHLELCASDEWARTVRNEILPWALAERDLGDHVLEVGPGPGRTTEVLRRYVARLTAVELDPDLARRLDRQMADSNVEVVLADATALPFPPARFSGATSFTMLHHVASADQQDRLLGELCRVLRPGGLLIGLDSIDSPDWRALHAGDTCTPVDPDTLGARLERAGFTQVEVERSSPAPARRFRFAGRARG